MYERNAIIIERYFKKIFGYDTKYNIKTNIEDYTKLVEILDKYQNTSEEEEVIMEEYDVIANKIMEKQKIQEELSKKNNKYQEERNSIVQTIGENAELLQKKIEQLNKNIDIINQQIKKNLDEFVSMTAEFNEKTEIRTQCERTLRTVGNDYNKILNEILDNYKQIDLKYVENARTFLENEIDEIERELKIKINQNGKNEKNIFNEDVINKSIELSIDIQRKEINILLAIFEKSNKLFGEIKSGSIKLEKHKKSAKDARCKLSYINAIQEYLIKFLDNERLTAVNTSAEHRKIMKDACINFNEDLEQINNLYSLLLKEMAKKSTKKIYKELYNVDYLEKLEKKYIEFDDEIKKLNLPVTVINPHQWRIEGMGKIYNIFYECVTEGYGRDLSDFVEKKEEKVNSEKVNFEYEEDKKDLKHEIIEVDEDLEQYDLSKSKEQKSEIDKKIDMILGINKDYSDILKNPNLDEEIDNYEEDDYDNDFGDEEFEESDFDDDFDDEEIEQDDYDNDFEDDDETGEYDNDFEDEDFEDEDFEDDDEYYEDKDNDDWKDQFVNVAKIKSKRSSQKRKKKKGLFGNLLK